MILLLITFVGPQLPWIDQELEETQYVWSDDGIPIPPPYEPNGQYWLGSDHDGRDLLSLIVMGAKENVNGRRVNYVSEIYCCNSFGVFSA
ncbi:hypothetical protein [Piscibacillus salipiscarius]|uniref:hypothetical protein n=1 Tax=Piscibacillus salipiscarius TaxID=299480 RepID=UPI0024371E0D|nr:hypothetical protein [Piscibacillus salipiscarius]